VPTRVYKDHLIVVSARPKDHGWRAVVDISWSAGGKMGSRTFELDDTFETQEEAEIFGFELATTWVYRNPH
jgi:hypothetical protein